MEIELTANGSRHRLRLDPRVTVLDASREHLGLTGSKKGCDLASIGEIGIAGINAAIASAVFHAAGKRVRELPIRLEDLL